MNIILADLSLKLLTHYYIFNNTSNMCCRPCRYQKQEVKRIKGSIEAPEYGANGY